MSSHLFIYQQQCFFRLCSVSSTTFFFSRLSVVNSNFNPKKSLQTLVITFTVRWWTPRSSSQHHTENMSSKFRPKKQFLNTRTGSFTPSLGPNFLPLFFPVSHLSFSHRLTAALFAFIKLRRKTRVSPFGGWSSASFTSIWVCLCGWVMDPVCWYVLLWWLQKLYSNWDSTVTHLLLCFRTTLRRGLFTQQTLHPPQHPPPG